MQIKFKNWKLTKEIEDIEENLKNKKKDLDVISGEVIPTMMSEMGLSQLKLMDGSQIDVKPFYNATITVANRESAFQLASTKWSRRYY